MKPTTDPYDPTLIQVPGVGQLTPDEYAALEEQANRELLEAQTELHNQHVKHLAETAAQIAAALKAHDYLLAANLIVGITGIHSQ